LFIELTEALDCPICRDEFGLVAFVDELQERRVLEGHLGCPECKAEYPIQGGGIDLSGLEDRSDTSRESDASLVDELAPTAECPDERAMEVAALLGVRERAGARLLLDEGLAACAAVMVGWGERIEILTLVHALASEGPLGSGPGVTPVAGATPAGWPIRPHALRGVALLGGSPDRLREAERVLTRGGRLTVLEPTPEVLDAIDDCDFEILAAEARALVGTRR
jgi:uncharacterized protein YbaR (Trm112 family)